MNLDPTKMKDWQIAEAAESNLRKARDLAKELDLRDDEWTPYGDVLAKIDVTKVLKRVGKGRNGKYIEVTAITPTALGEGKTTTTLGLVQGLGRLGKKVIGCVRQPSGGPTFNIKGSAAGGGLAQVVPLTSLSLGLTGDIDAITNANNLAMVALNSVKCTVKSGYSWVTSINISSIANVTASSSLHSRIRACSFVSPGSTLPPTNSQRSPLALCAGRWQIMNLLFFQMRAATTSVTFISLQFLNSSNIDMCCHSIRVDGYCLPRIR